MSINGGMPAAWSLKPPTPTEMFEGKELKTLTVFAYLLIFFCGLPEWASEFTYFFSGL